MRLEVILMELSQDLKKNIWFQAIGKVMDIYTNYDKKNKCVEYHKGDDYGNLDASGWDYQVTMISNKNVFFFCVRF